MPPKAADKLVRAPAPPDAVPTPAINQQRQHSTGIADLELPKTTLTKLAKGSIPDNVKMQQDVVTALLRSSTLFISYLTAVAHDQAISRSGKSVTAADVLKAIAELDFGPADALLPLLERELAAFRSNVAASKANKAKATAASRANAKARRKSAATDADTSMAVDDGEDDEDGEEGEGEGDGEGEGEGDEEEDEEEGEGENA